MNYKNTYLMLQDIEELRLIHESVDNLLIIPFPFEGSENPVPNNQDSGVILVQAVAIWSWIQIFSIQIYYYCMTWILGIGQFFEFRY